MLWDVLGLTALEIALRLALTIRVVEIERMFPRRLSNYTVGWLVCGVIVAFRRVRRRKELNPQDIVVGR